MMGILIRLLQTQSVIRLWVRLESTIRLRTEAGKMPEGTALGIGTESAGLMTIRVQGASRFVVITR